jgi:hypothetical protein
MGMKDFPTTEYISQDAVIQREVVDNLHPENNRFLEDKDKLKN